MQCNSIILNKKIYTLSKRSWKLTDNFYMNIFYKYSMFPGRYEEQHKNFIHCMNIMNTKKI